MYATIEGEAFSVVFRLQHCRIFMMGPPNRILVMDHKPLKILPIERFPKKGVRSLCRILSLNEIM